MEVSSTKQRKDGLLFVVLGSVIFVLLGLTFEYFSPHPMPDFRLIYNSNRCLLQGLDPYQRDQFLKVLLADGVQLGTEPQRSQYLEMARYLYPPTSAVLAPLALLNWDAALLVWSLLLAGLFVIASLCMFDAAKDQAPLLAGLLLFGYLATSQLQLITGNVAAIAISLCLIASWCFLSERFVYAGVVGFALALVLKPHDSGLVWLCFLLAGGMLRKRAWQTLAVACAVSISPILWVNALAPKWLIELRANLTALSVRGGLLDPGPTSMAGHGLAMIVDLQTAFSVFYDKPEFYNLATYAVCGVLLAIWGYTTYRSRPSGRRVWFALAAVSALSMLPVYHRTYDAKLLMLTIPACAMLWVEGGVLAWLALAVNALGLLLTCDFFWVMLLSFFSSLPSWISNGPVGLALQMMPVPLTLLAVGVFYLWVYVRDSIRVRS